MHAPDPRQLRDAVRALVIAHGTLRPNTRPCGTPLSTPHAYALLELRQTSALTVSALAERLSIDRTNVSRLVARMVERGEVERQLHPTDRRARVVRLTPAGRALADRVDAASAGHFAALLDHLGPDGAAVVAHLHRLTAAMRTPPRTPAEDVE